MKRLIALTILGVASASAFAQQLSLDPSVPFTLFTSNSNDGYGAGRGMWFQANSSFNILGAGFNNDFFGNENFTETLYAADSTGTALHGTLLGSFSMNPVAGIGFQDGTFSSAIGVTAGNYYYLEVISNSSFANNYFYDWNGSPTVNLGLVTILDGGQDGDPSALGNTVAPGLRIMTDTVPEPATLAVLGLGALALIRRRRSTKA